MSFASEYFDNCLFEVVYAFGFGVEDAFAIDKSLICFIFDLCVGIPKGVVIIY
jgi:hypothetical protein